MQINLSRYWIANFNDTVFANCLLCSELQFIHHFSAFLTVTILVRVEIWNRQLFPLGFPAVGKRKMESKWRSKGVFQTEKGVFQFGKKFVSIFETHKFVGPSLLLEVLFTSIFQSRSQLKSYQKWISLREQVIDVCRLKVIKFWLQGLS